MEVQILRHRNIRVQRRRNRSKRIKSTGNNSKSLNDTTWRNKRTEIESKVPIHKATVKPIMTYTVETRPVMLKT